MGIEGIYLNIIKASYDKPTVNIIMMKSLPNEIWNMTRMSTLITSLQCITGDSSHRQGKEIKGIQIGKEDVKLSLYADDMMLYLENTKGTRDQTANTRLIVEKAWEFQKNIYFCFIDHAKVSVWITTNYGKFLKRWEYQTT